MSARWLKVVIILAVTVLLFCIAIAASSSVFAIPILLFLEGGCRRRRVAAIDSTGMSRTFETAPYGP